MGLLTFLFPNLNPEFRAAAEKHERDAVDLLSQSRWVISHRDSFVYNWGYANRTKVTLSKSIDKISVGLGLRPSLFPHGEKNFFSFYEDTTKQFEEALDPARKALMIHIQKEDQSSEAYESLLARLKDAKTKQQQALTVMEDVQPLTDIDLSYLREHLLREQHSHIKFNDTRLQLMLCKRELVTFWSDRLTDEVKEIGRKLGERIERIQDEKLAFEDPEAYQELIEKLRKKRINDQKRFERLLNLTEMRPGDPTGF